MDSPPDHHPDRRQKLNKITFSGLPDRVSGSPHLAGELPWDPAESRLPMPQMGWYWMAQPSLGTRGWTRVCPLLAAWSVRALVSAHQSLFRPASLRGLELDGDQDVSWGSPLFGRSKADL